MDERKVEGRGVRKVHINESESLDLLRLLDALGRWNSHFDSPTEQEPEPEGTGAYRVDAQTSGYIARQLGLYPAFVWMCFQNVPVKQAKSIRDWLISQMDAEPEFDALKALYRWAVRHADEFGLEPDEELYSEAREDLNQKMRTY